MGLFDGRMELDELYQQVILDHAKRPRNRRELPQCSAMAVGENPSCGDEVTVYINLTPEGRIADATFTGNGCAISQAAASILTGQVNGKSREAAREIIESFHASLGKEGETLPEDERIGNLAALGGVRKFPQRIKCATLASHALEDALGAVRAE